MDDDGDDAVAVVCALDVALAELQWVCFASASSAELLAVVGLDRLLDPEIVMGTARAAAVCSALRARAWLDVEREEVEEEDVVLVVVDDELDECARCIAPACEREPAASTSSRRLAAAAVFHAAPAPPAVLVLSLDRAPPSSPPIRPNSFSSLRFRV